MTLNFLMTPDPVISYPNVAHPCTTRGAPLSQDKVIHKLKEVLSTKGMREAGFPSKVSLPLYLGVNAAVTFDNCKVFKPGELEPELFLVNPNYSSSRRMRKVCRSVFHACKAEPYVCAIIVCTKNEIPSHRVCED